MRHMKMKHPKDTNWWRRTSFAAYGKANGSQAQRLPSVVELAEAYGIGRSTIREASALKAMGWLDVRHGGGDVRPNRTAGRIRRSQRQELAVRGAESLIELLEVRRTLEIRPPRSRQSFERPPTSRSFAPCSRQWSRALSRRYSCEQADTDFHMAIAAASEILCSPS